MKISQKVSELLSGHEIMTDKLKDRQGDYSRTSMARTPLDHENMFETGEVRANEC